MVAYYPVSDISGFTFAIDDKVIMCLLFVSNSRRWPKKKEAVYAGLRKNNREN